VATLARHHRALAVRKPVRARSRRTEWPLWLQVTVLYSTLALIVGFVIALCFVIAWLATGSAI
jgi:hypothetical protein